MRTIRFTFTRPTTLNPVWFDDLLLDELLSDGVSYEDALREMLRVGWEEDWTSIVGEMLGAIGMDAADAFAKACTNIEIVEEDA